MHYYYTCPGTEQSRQPSIASTPSTLHRLLFFSFNPIKYQNQNIPFPRASPAHWTEEVIVKKWRVLETLNGRRIVFFFQEEGRGEGEPMAVRTSRAAVVAVYSHGRYSFIEERVRERQSDKINVSVWFYSYFHIVTADEGGERGIRVAADAVVGGKRGRESMTRVCAARTRA